MKSLALLFTIQVILMGVVDVSTTTTTTRSKSYVNVTTPSSKGIHNNNRPNYRQLFCVENVSPPEPINLTSFIVLIVFIPVTIFGNIIVIVVVLMSRNLRRQTTYIFLVSLGIADTLIGCIVMPIKAKISFNNGLFCLSTGACWFYVITEIMLSISSLAHLAVLALDRYISLKYAYEYDTILSRYRTFLIITVTWLFSFAWALLGIFKWSNPSELSIQHKHEIVCGIDNREYFTVLYVLYMILPVILMTYTYTYVYKTAIRHINEISKLDVSSKQVKDNNRKKRQMKTLKSIIIVFIVYAVCWIPMAIFNVSSFYGRGATFWAEINGTWYFDAIYFIVVLFLPAFNSTTNPFIYVLSNKQFKFYFQKVFTQITGIPIRKTGNVDLHFTTGKTSVVSMGHHIGTTVAATPCEV